MKLSKDDVVQNFGVSLRFYNGLQVVNDKNMSSPEKAEGAYIFKPDYNKFGFKSLPYSKINPDVNVEAGKVVKQWTVRY